MVLQAGEKLCQRTTAAMSTRGRNVPLDRGWAWMCVVSCFTLLLIELGGAKSFGVVLAEFLDKTDSGVGAAAWISSLNGFFGMALGPFATSLGLRFSNRTMIMLGGFFYGLGYFLSGFGPHLSFLYFSYGVITGLGMGLSYSPAIVTVAQYFETRRALANGIAVAGSGVGNFIIPLTMRYLIDNYGLRGALMIYGGIGFNVIVCGALMRPMQFYRDRKFVTSKGGDTLGDRRGSEYIHHSESEKATHALDPRASENRLTVSTNVRNSLDDAYLLTQASANHSIHHLPDLRNDDEMHGSVGSFRSLRERRHSSFYGLSELPTASAQSIQDKVSQSHVNESEEDHPSSAESTLRLCFLRMCTLPPDKNGQPKPIFDWSLLKNPIFHVYYWAVLLSSCGYPSVFIMLPKFATEGNLSNAEAAWLVSIVGLSDLVGRIAFGFVADYNIIKKRHGFMGSMLLSGATCLVFPFVRSFVGLAVCCTVFGLFGGSYIALIAVILVEALGAEKLPNAFGLSVLGQGIAMLLSFPFIGFLRDQTGTWNYSFYFCGILMIAGSLCVLFEPLAERKHRAPKTRTNSCCNHEKEMEVVSQI